MIMAGYTKSQTGLVVLPPDDAASQSQSSTLPYRYLARTIAREFPRAEAGTSLVFCAPDGDRISTNVLLLLAHCLYQELSASVLVVDARTADLGGGVTERLGMGASTGFKDLLRSDPGLLEQTVRSSGVPGVSVLPRGRESDEPAFTLGQSLPHLLSRAKALHDYVLLQINPVAGDTRSMVTATLADAVVLLALENHTLMSTLRAAEQLLRGNGAREIRAVVVEG